MKKLLILIALVIGADALAVTPYVKSCERYLKNTARTITIYEERIDFCKCVEMKLKAQFGSSNHMSTVYINRTCAAKTIN